MGGGAAGKDHSRGGKVPGADASRAAGGDGWPSFKAFAGIGFSHHAHTLVTPGRQFPGPRLTATVTATAATDGKRQRPATAHNSRTIRANLGYVRPEKQKAGSSILPPVTTIHRAVSSVLIRANASASLLAAVAERPWWQRGRYRRLRCKPQRGLPPGRRSRSAFSARSPRSRSDPASSSPSEARRAVPTGQRACISITAAVCSTIVSTAGT
jgi:hypothetical protein